LLTVIPKKKAEERYKISDKDRKTIRAIARKYRVSKVLLFGSSLCESAESRDIDLAIEGIADADYFAFYGELLCALSKPVDVIDLSQKSKFVDLIKREGVRLDA
jgi:predicted nucleotidyltransferase